MLGVVATILGVSVTIGFGVSQFVDGIYAVLGMEWLMDSAGDTPKLSTVGLIAALFAIMGLSILSAVSGVGRGIKYLSNLNLVLSIILLATFVIYGSFFFAMTKFSSGLVDYLLHFAQLSFGPYPLKHSQTQCLKLSSPCLQRMLRPCMAVLPMPGDRWTVSRKPCRHLLLQWKTPML